MSKKNIHKKIARTNNNPNFNSISHIYQNKTTSANGKKAQYITKYAHTGYNLSWMNDFVE